MNFGVWISRAECTPRGAYAPAAPGCTTFVRSEKATFALHKRTLTRAAGVSPPWFGTGSQVHAEGIVAISCWHAEQRTTGGLRPPLRGKRATAKETIFASAQSHAVKQRRASARRGFANRVCNCNTLDFRVSSSHTEYIPTGGLRPRSCVAMRMSNGEKNDFCDEQTHVRKSGGRQPAVVSERICKCNARLGVRSASECSHGGLTPCRSWLHARGSLRTCVCDLR
jgi:hypothetical protein